MAYAKSRRIVIDKTKVGGSNSTSFPMLFSGTYYWLANTANGGSVSSKYGYDIGFFADKALTKPLYWEVETYVGTTGAIVAWVQIPILSATVDTVIYLAYGDSTITTFQSNAARVWDDSFRGVWHLPDSTNLGARDSSAYANHGTITSATASTGQIDGAATFAGTQYIDVPNVTNLDVTTSYTISGWFNLSSLTTGIGLSKGVPSNFNTVGIAYIGGLGIIGFIFGGGVPAAVVTPSTATWYHIVLTGTTNGAATDMRAYANGVLVTTSLSQTAVTTSAGSLRISGYSNSTTPWAGSIDEARWANAPRSAAWIQAEYNNQSAPSSFYSIGSDTLVSFQYSQIGAGTLLSTQSSSQLVRTSTGNLYAIVISSGDLDIYKSVDNGATWVEKDYANVPFTTQTGAAVAIDGSDNLHISFAPTSTQISYVKFTTSSDTFGRIEPVLTVGTAFSSTSIAVDTNGVPHIVANSSNQYANRTSGAWRALTLVAASGRDASILIDQNNIPQISYINTGNSRLEVAIGNKNNASSFTITNLVATGAYINSGGTSIVLDSLGNTWVAYQSGGDGPIQLAKHRITDSWATWQTAITNGYRGSNLVLASDWTDIYVFYERNSGGIAFDKYDSINNKWLGEQIIQPVTDRSGTNFRPHNPLVKWSRYFNNGQSDDNNKDQDLIEYLFDDGSTVYYANVNTGQISTGFAQINFSAPAGAFTTSTSSTSSSTSTSISTSSTSSSISTSISTSSTSSSTSISTSSTSSSISTSTSISTSSTSTSTSTSISVSTSSTSRSTSTSSTSTSTSISTSSTSSSISTSSTSSSISTSSTSSSISTSISTSSTSQSTSTSISTSSTSSSTSISTSSTSTSTTISTSSTSTSLSTSTSISTSSTSSSISTSISTSSTSTSLSTSSTSTSTSVSTSTSTTISFTTSTSSTSSSISTSSTSTSFSTSSTSTSFSTSSTSTSFSTSSTSTSTSISTSSTSTSISTSSTSMSTSVSTSISTSSTSTSTSKSTSTSSTSTSISTSSTSSSISTSSTSSSTSLSTSTSTTVSVTTSTSSTSSSISTSSTSTSISTSSTSSSISTSISTSSTSTSVSTSTSISTSSTSSSISTSSTSSSTSISTSSTSTSLSTSSTSTSKSTSTSVSTSSTSTSTTVSITTSTSSTSSSISTSSTSSSTSLSTSSTSSSTSLSTSSTSRSTSTSSTSTSISTSSTSSSTSLSTSSTSSSISTSISTSSTSRSTSTSLSTSSTSTSKSTSTSTTTVATTTSTSSTSRSTSSTSISTSTTTTVIDFNMKPRVTIHPYKPTIYMPDVRRT